MYDHKHVCQPTFRLGAWILKDFTCKQRQGDKLGQQVGGSVLDFSKLGKGLFKLQKVGDPKRVSVGFI